MTALFISTFDPIQFYPSVHTPLSFRLTYYPLECIYQKVSVRHEMPLFIFQDILHFNLKQQFIRRGSNS